MEHPVEAGTVDDSGVGSRTDYGEVVSDVQIATCRCIFPYPSVREDVSAISYTMYALEATEYAGEQRQFDPFHRGLYQAYWEKGSDLGDLEVIRASPRSVA